MLLFDLVTTSRRVAATRSRTEKIGALAELLRRLAPEEIAAEVEELKMSIQRHRVERDREAASIDDVLLQRYDMIFRRRGGLAVAVAKSGTCQGCRMRLPPQLLQQLGHGVFDLVLR